MRKLACLLVACTVVSAFNIDVASAKAFDPEFTVTKIKGAVDIRLPNSPRFVDAEVDGVYAYGSSLRTKRRASAEILFSQGNTCSIEENTIIDISEDSLNKMIKLLNLRTGKLDITFNEMVDQQQVHIETAVAVCGITGTKLSVKAERTPNLSAMFVKVMEVGSSVWLRSDFFIFEELGAGREIVCTMTDSGEYFRCRILSGPTKVKLLTDGGDRVLDVETGDLLKFFIRKHAEYLQITAMLYPEDSDKPKDVVTFRKKRAPEPGKHMLPGLPIPDNRDPQTPATSTTTTTIVGIEPDPTPSTDTPVGSP